MKQIVLSIIMVITATLGSSCSGDLSDDKIVKKEKTLMAFNNDSSAVIATFGSGCFWCTEAIFESLKGVNFAVSGYMGGKSENPTYKEVCTGLSGHAEVVQVSFNPAVISFEELLEAFWASHDPTTLNRQGNDVGTQYRSVIFYHGDEQKKIAEAFKTDLNARKVFPNPIVTEISPASSFYEAENYHQEYFELNGNEPYCSYVIRPKLDKFRKAFAEKLKEK